MKQNHVLIKGHVLYANKGTTIKNVCNHLQSRRVDRIIVRNSHEKEIGYVPLCRIFQLLQRKKSLCEQLIRQMNLEQIADALHGKIMYAPSAEHMFWQCILYEEHLFDDLRHALVITGENKTVLSQLLESEASCIVAAHCDIMSHSLIEKAQKNEMVLIRTSQVPTAAEQSIWMNVSLGNIMERFLLRD